MKNVDFKFEGSNEAVAETVAALLVAYPNMRMKLEKFGLPAEVPTGGDRVFLAGYEHNRFFHIVRSSLRQVVVLDIDPTAWPFNPMIRQVPRHGVLGVKRMGLYRWRGDCWNRYEEIPERRFWTHEEEEVLFDFVASARNKRELKQLFARHDKIWGRTVQKTIRGVVPRGGTEWHAYALFGGARDMKHVPTGQKRIVRRGPLTFGEEWLLSVAVKCKTEDRVAPSVEYLTMLLNRSLDAGLVSDFLAASKERKTGFGLVPNRKTVVRGTIRVS